MTNNETIIKEYVEFIVQFEAGTDDLDRQLQLKELRRVTKAFLLEKLNQRSEEIVKEVEERVFERIPKSGTQYSGYWLWEGKRMNYNQTVYTTMLLEVFDILKSKYLTTTEEKKE